MKRINDLYNFLKERLFSSTYQLQRVVILVAIALVLAVVSFGSYYYYDRYYTSQPKTAQMGLEEAEKAVRQHPDDPEVRLGLAETYMINKRFEDAIVVASEVMKTYPDNQRAWLLIGVSNALKGNPTGAIDPLQNYVDANKDTEMQGLNKSLISAAYYLGDSYLQMGQPEKAVPPLEMTVKWSQTDADAMYKLGIAYLGVKQYKEAVTEFQSATLFVPNFTEAYEGMAAAFTALNDVDYANYANGMVAYSKKDYRAALPLLLKVSKTKPDFIPAYDGLGLTYEALGDLKSAKTSYESAVKFNPNDFTATTGLQRVTALLNK